MAIKFGFLLLVVTIACAAAKSSDGEGCILTSVEEEGEFGVCTHFNDCASAKGASCRGTPPQACASYDEDGSVCCKSLDCPPLPSGLVNIPLTGYKAWDYCANIAKLAYPCLFMGDSTTRDDACPVRTNQDSTGEEVLPGDYPHLVLLSATENEWNYVSTGTLISEKWVLTSAYTVIFNVKYAKVGGLAAGGTVLNIARSIQHPDYVITAVYNAIALVELEKNVVFSKLILPACLHTGSVLPEEKLKNIVGRTTYLSSDVDIIPHEDCSKIYDKYLAIVPNKVNEFTQFCIQRTSGSYLGGINGAPIQVHNGASVACTQTVLGVLASNTDEVHLINRVTPYISWIESIVWP